MANDKPIKLGKTGEYPDGKLNKDDEGALNIGIMKKDNVIVLEFGTQVHWLALPPDQARLFAETIIQVIEE